MNSEKIKNLFSIILRLFIAAMVIFIVIPEWYRDKVEPPDYADPQWYSLTPDKIESVIISPLLNESTPCSSTIDKSVSTGDVKLINDLRTEMQGEHSMFENMSDKWISDKRMRILFRLRNGNMIVFRITFHYKYKVADYYKLDSPKDVYYTPNFAGRGSRKLYDILMNQVELNRLSWVNANVGCWKINGMPEYKTDCNIRCIQ
jgi:hypothetical protein